MPKLPRLAKVNSPPEFIVGPCQGAWGGVLGPRAFCLDSVYCGVNLTSLDLSVNYIVPTSPLSIDLSANTRLTSLNLRDSKLTTITGLGLLTNLRTIDLSDNHLTTVDLTANTSFTTLDLSGNRLTSLKLAGLTRLRTLDLSDNQLNFLALHNGGVFSLSGLTSLNLSKNDITGFAVSSQPLPNLKILDVSDNVIGDFRGFNNHSNLERMDLSGNRLAPIRLSGVGNLEYLDLSDNVLTSSGTALSNLGGNLDFNAHELLEIDVRNNSSLGRFDATNLTSVTLLWKCGNTSVTRDPKANVNNLQIPSNACRGGV